MPKNKSVTDMVSQFRALTNKLDKRQRVLLMFLVVTLTGSVFFNRILKPQLVEVRRVRNELGQLDRKIMALKAQMPAIEKEKIKLDEARINNKKLKETLQSLEKELPESYQISRLLGELARQAGSSGVDFAYIKPKSLVKAQDNEEYSQLDIEMQFNAPYYDFKDYLGRLERLSVFLSVTDIVAEEIKEAAGQGDVTVTMVLSTLLNRQHSGAYTYRNLTEVQKELPLTEDGEERLPFVPTSAEAGRYLANKKFVLSGITYSKSNPTAIINNQMYRVGDTLNDDWKVKQILRDMVIITRGRQAETLTIEKEERLNVKKK
jgi:Tfp pilus assembly protein PilO